MHSQCTRYVPHTFLIGVAITSENILIGLRCFPIHMIGLQWTLDETDRFVITVSWKRLLYKCKIG